jgi:hypothetical protein
LPQGQPDVAETPPVAPANGVEADADDVGIVGRRRCVVVGEEAEFLNFAMAVVEGDGALPAAFFSAVEFTRVSDDLLARGPASVRTLSTSAK